MPNDRKKRKGVLSERERAQLWADIRMGHIAVQEIEAAVLRAAARRGIAADLIVMWPTWLRERARSLKPKKPRRYCAACGHSEERHNKEVGCLRAAPGYTADFFCACVKFSPVAHNIRRGKHAR